jgi:hypothetical protein
LEAEPSALDTVVTIAAQCHQVREFVGCSPVAVEGPNGNEVVYLGTFGFLPAAKTSPTIPSQCSRALTSPVIAIWHTSSEAAGVGRVALPSNEFGAARPIAEKLFVAFEDCGPNAQGCSALRTQRPDATGRDPLTDLPPTLRATHHIGCEVAGLACDGVTTDLAWSCHDPPLRESRAGSTTEDVGELFQAPGLNRDCDAARGAVGVWAYSHEGILS